MEQILKRRKLKKLLSFVLSLTMLFTLIQVNNITAKANEAETYSFSLGTGADEGKLIATCNGECGNAGDHVYKLTLSARPNEIVWPTETYAASIVDEAGVDISDMENAWIQAGIAAPTVEFKIGDTWGTDAPTEAGSYSVRMYPGDETDKSITKDFNILPALVVPQEFTMEHTASGTYKITSITYPEGFDLYVGATTKAAFEEFCPENVDHHEFMLYAMNINVALLSA